MMQQLLMDTLQFLDENFEKTTSWNIPPSQIHLKEKKRKKQVVSFKKQETPKLEPKHPETSKQEILYDVKEQIISSVSEEKKPITSNFHSKPIEAPKLSVESLSDAVKKLFPEFATHAAPPQEKDLKTSSIFDKALNAQVVLFSFREGKESDLFLQNVSIAIQGHFCSAAAFDAKRWELEKKSFETFFKECQAKLFIAPESIYKKSSLLPFLKEIPSSSEKFLGSGRLLVLNPFQTYFNHPLSKKELWKTLCATLKSLTDSQGLSSTKL